MMNSALARTMQIQRTTVTSRFAQRSSRSRNFTDCPLPADDLIRKLDSTFRYHVHTRRAADHRRPQLRPGTARLEILLAVENERDRLLDAEPLALFLHQARHRFDERRLVRRDDLDEVALERGEILHLGNLPCAAHIGLRPRTRVEHRLLLLRL